MVLIIWIMERTMKTKTMSDGSIPVPCQVRIVRLCPWHSTISTIMVWCGLWRWSPCVFECISPIDVIDNTIVARCRLQSLGSVDWIAVVVWIVLVPVRLPNRIESTGRVTPPPPFPLPHWYPRSTRRHHRHRHGGLVVRELCG